MSKSPFFVKASNTKPYLKVAFEGFAGSGKTQTAARLAIGLHKKIKSTKPIIMFDTEKSSKFLTPMFEAENIELMVRESRTLVDLIKTMDFMQSGVSDILIIDSISHVWEEFIEAYKKDVDRTRLYIQDWGVVKPKWKKEFADRLVRDSYHTLMCGRASYEYDSELNEKNKREMFRSGIKMRAETETAYEPDCLVFMERHENLLDQKDKEIWRTATILKDRSTVIDSKIFEYHPGDPVKKVYDDFSPMINTYLSEPAEWTGIKEEGSEKMFPNEKNKSNYIEDKEIALEKIQAEILKVYPSSKAEDKQGKVQLLEQHFGTTSWKEIQKMSLKHLLEGLEKLENN